MSETSTPPGPRLYWRALDADRGAPPAAGTLNATQTARLATLTGDGRRLEYRRSRELLQGALARENPQADLEQVPAAGPPRLPREWGLYGALAHSGTLAVCAVHNAPVGLDIEPRQRRIPWQRLAQRWFSPAEQKALAGLEEDLAREHFLLLWTLKEAWLKASHQGIANNLQQLQLEEGDRDPQRWHLSLPPGATGWQAAAVDFQGYWLSLFWQGEALPGTLSATLSEKAETNRPWQLLTRPRPRTG